MTRKALLPLIVLSAMIAGGAMAQSPPSPPADAGTDKANWGTMPYSAPEQPLMMPEHKQAMRDLEDRQIKEARALEDKYDADRMALRRKQADEREALKRTFR